MDRRTALGKVFKFKVGELPGIGLVWLGRMLLVAEGEDEGGIGVFLFIEDGIDDLQGGLEDSDLSDQSLGD